MAQFEGIVNYLGINNEPYYSCGYCHGSKAPGAETGKFQAGKPFSNVCLSQMFAFDNII